MQKDPTSVVPLRIVSAIINLFAVAVPFYAVFFALAEKVSTTGTAGAGSVVELDQVRFQLGDNLYFVTGGKATLLNLLWVGIWALNSIVLAGLTGASVGKHLTGLRIVKAADGSQAGIVQTGIRTVVGIVDFACCGIIGLILVLTMKGKRRLGDLAAGTLVVRKGDVGRVRLDNGVVLGLDSGNWAPVGAVAASGAAWAGSAPGGAPGAGGWGQPPQGGAPSGWQAPAPQAGAPGGGWQPPAPQGSAPGAWQAPAPQGSAPGAWQAPAPQGSAPGAWQAPAPAPQGSAPGAWQAPAPQGSAPGAWQAPAPDLGTPGGWAAPEPSGGQTPAATPSAAPAAQPSAWPTPSAASDAAPSWSTPDYGISTAADATAVFTPGQFGTPTPEPAPAPVPAPTAEKMMSDPGTPSADIISAAAQTPGQPVWDASRARYVIADPAGNGWLQSDDAGTGWVPLV